MMHVQHPSNSLPVCRVEARCVLVCMCAMQILAGQSNMIGNNYADGEDIHSIPYAVPLQEVIITFPAWNTAQYDINTNYWLTVNTLQVSVGDRGNGFVNGLMPDGSAPPAIGPEVSGA